MSDVRNPDSDDESEFGLGVGMMDEVQRASGRDALPVYQGQWEIMALPKTFDNSMPDRPAVEETPVPRLLPGDGRA